MATTVNEPPFQDRRTAERRRYPAASAAWLANPFRVSWSGIWAGVFAALGILLLLATLGLAVGITAMDLDQADAGAIGMGAAIWGALSLLVALFVGGMLSTRLSLITDRSTSFYEGALVWVLSVILIMYLAASGIGMLAGGVFNIVGGAGRTVAAAAGGADIELTEGNVDQIVARLQDPQTAQQVATVTGLPQGEVSAHLNQTAQAVQAARDDPAQAAAEVRRSIADLMARAQPMERLEQAGRTSAWVMFFSLLLSLGAAVGGAALGRRGAVQRTHAAPAA